MESARLAETEASATPLLHEGPQAPRAQPAEAASPWLGSSRYGYTFRRVLFGADVVALMLAGAAASAVEVAAGRGGPNATEVSVFLAFVVLWLVLAGGLGLYHAADRRVEYSFVNDLGSVFTVTTTWIWLFVLALSAVSSGPIELLWPAVLWATVILCVLSMRVFARAAARNRSWYRQAVVLVGEGEEIDRILRRIRRHPEWGLDPIASVRFVSDQPLLDRLGVDGVRSTERIGHDRDGGQAAAVAEAVQSLNVTRAIVASGARTLSERTELIRRLAEEQICVDYVSGEPEALYSSAVLHHLEGLPVLSVQPTNLGRTAEAAKRCLDVFASALGLLLLSPFFAYAAIRIKLDSPGPVFFRHRRVGRAGAAFEMVKFRTMVTGADAMRGDLREAHQVGGRNGLFKLRDDPRITPVGRRLRRSSLDELPQLWNVLRGDMSLVGPRPLPLDEAPLVIDHFRARLRMRPGITGPWQTQGRSDIPFEDMVKLDYTYVVGWSMREDLSILLRTASAVARGRGAY